MAPRKLRPATTLLGHSSWSLRCAISADGKLALSGDGVPSARIWDLEEPSQSREFSTDAPIGIRQCALSADGSIAAVAAEGHSVSVHDVVTGERIFTIDEPQREKVILSAGGCALSPDGTVLVGSFRAANRAHGQLQVVRWRNTHAQPRIFERNYSIWQCEISDDANRIAFKYWKGSRSGVELIDARSGTLLGRWGNVVGEWDFAIDSTAQTLVTADSRALRVLDVGKNGDGNEVRTMRSYTFSAFAGCDISADGKHVVSPMADHKFGIWNTGTGKLVAVLSGHKNRSNGCAISADGTRVLTCSNDHTVRVWDTRNATSDSGGDQLRETLRVLLTGEARKDPVHEFVVKETQEIELGDASELLQVHTCLVMALRSANAAQDRDARISIKESASKVYASVEGKLHDKPEVQLGQVVMAHAEQRDLLARGLPTRHMGTYYKLMDKAMRKLRENVHSIWDEVAPLHEDDNVDDELARHLNRLHDSLKIGSNEVGDELYPSIAACSLLVWPGSINKNTAASRDRMPPRSIKSMLSTLGSEDVAGIELLMPFDVSSPRVLRHLLSKSSIEKLPPRHRHLIYKAISKSSFSKTEAIKIELTALIDKLARAKGKKPSMMDIDIVELPESEDLTDNEQKEHEDSVYISKTSGSTVSVVKKENEASQTFNTKFDETHSTISVLETNQAVTITQVNSSTASEAEDMTTSEPPVDSEAEVVQIELPLESSKVQIMPRDLKTTKIAPPEFANVENRDIVVSQSPTKSPFDKVTLPTRIEHLDAVESKEFSSGTPNVSMRGVPTGGTTVVVRSVQVREINHTIVTDSIQTTKHYESKPKPQQLIELQRSSAIKTYVPEISSESPSDSRSELETSIVHPMEEVEREIIDTSQDNQNIVIENVEDEFISVDVAEPHDDVSMLTSPNKRDEFANVDTQDTTGTQVAQAEADIEAGVTTRQLRRSRRRRRKQQNIVLGVIALASFFICAALLTLVVLRTR